MEGRETKKELIIMLLVFIIGLICVLSFLKEGTLQGVLALSLSIGILNIFLNIAFPDKKPEKEIIKNTLTIGEPICKANQTYMIEFQSKETKDIIGTLLLKMPVFWDLKGFLSKILITDKKSGKQIDAHITIKPVNLDVGQWIKFDWENKESRPTKYGKYLVCRKDGKIHFEIWNGNGFAYNTEVIKYWCKIKPPFITPQNDMFL